ncbi:hypothetical protein K8942_05240 [Candidatus Peribacteria bacterium]|nr:MAG: hypothetical protein K8942_05240 [Candidatus Peribacteria bacterium]
MSAIEHQTVEATGAESTQLLRKDQELSRVRTAIHTAICTRLGKSWKVSSSSIQGTTPLHRDGQDISTTHLDIVEIFDDVAPILGLNNAEPSRAEVRIFQQATVAGATQYFTNLYSTRLPRTGMS